MSDYNRWAIAAHAAGYPVCRVCGEPLPAYSQSAGRCTECANAAGNEWGGTDPVAYLGDNRDDF